MSIESIHQTFNTILLLIVIVWLYEPWAAHRRKKAKPPTEIPSGAYVIDVAEDFSPIPGGRKPEDGPFNGEHFRERYLIPAMEFVYHQPSLDKKNDVVVVDISEIYGLPASWLLEVTNSEYIWLNSSRVIFYSSEPSNWPMVRLAEKYISEWPRRK